MARRDKNIWIKFETKSNRVKGLAFHPKRPWILASLHDGAIQLWDYRMETMIEKYEEHDGPVRGIHFHSTQPLFVSGGDDYKIKVWNYQRCLFNLLGHLDYIRTVQFHHEYPWIISASDDQTIRIWNWQSRTCLSVLTGHNHYVMSASFHPKEDLIISASLDQTVRVWDFSVLRKKNVSIATDFGSGSLGSQPDNLFGNSDVVVRHVLEGHSRGVNWAAFHPSINFIVSGADDREVKLWRMNETKAWEIDTMRGHISNVSCVMFHPKKDLVISNSEDKSIRVWDTSKQTAGSFSDWPSSVSGAQQVFRRDHDRYWILDVHQNLVAAGHDSGLLVFKLSRERPAMDTLGPRLYFSSKLFVYEMDQRKDTAPRPILTTRASQEGRRGQLNNSPRTLSYNFSNQSHHCILLTWDQDSSYELYSYPKTETGRDAVHAPIRGFGRCAVFVSRSRFAVLDRQRVIYLKNLKNESKRKVTLPGNPACSYIFPGGLGKLLIRAATGMILYDCEALRVIAEFTGQTRHPIKYVSWSPNNKFVAMWSKTNIFILDSKVAEQSSITETSRIKSGSWDPIGVFVYTTHTHIKYLLPNGDNGVIKTLDFPIYLTGVNASTIYYIDREEKTGKMAIDTTEYQFKIALMENRKREVLEIIHSKKLVGASIIAYLEKKGFPELALHFVEDDNIKFSLALECGNIMAASECAKKLDKKECWHKLGVEGLRQGNHEVVESAYQKTKNFERLSFLYLITGNPRLQKMLQIATIRKDRVGMFHNALYLGDVEERVKILQEAGQIGLALLTAKTHGLENANELEEQFRQHYEQLGQPVPEVNVRPDAKLFLPPRPILKNTTWPLLEVKRPFFDIEAMGQDDGGRGPSVPEPSAVSGKKEIEDKGPADDDFPSDFPDDSTEKPTKTEEKGIAWKGAGLDDLLGPDDGLPGADDGKEEPATEKDDYDIPSQGKSVTEKWSSSYLAADMVAAGQFDQAMHLLARQLGVINFDPLKSNFMTIYSSAAVLLPTLPSSTPITCHLTRQTDGKDEALPLLAFKLENCVEELKLAYKAVSDGQFKTAIDHFTSILHTIPFVVVEKKAQEQEVLELISVCKEYLTAMRIETARREEKVEPARQAALSAYFTHCKIQTLHLLLGLKIAIKCSYTINNFVTTARFCRRVLELVASATSANVAKVVDAKQIKAVLKVCEKKESDAQPIDYDESKVFSICCDTLTPVYRGKPEVRCPFCQSAYHGSADGSLCKTCQLSKVGSQTTGLRCFSS